MCFATKKKWGGCGSPSHGSQSLSHCQSFAPTLSLLFFPLGKKLKFTIDNGKLHNVSLGQGQEVVAENALDVAAEKGHWVILQVRGGWVLSPLGVGAMLTPGCGGWPWGSCSPMGRRQPYQAERCPGQPGSGGCQLLWWSCGFFSDEKDTGLHAREPLKSMILNTKTLVTKAPLPLRGQQPGGLCSPFWGNPSTTPMSPSSPRLAP